MYAFASPFAEPVAEPVRVTVRADAADAAFPPQIDAVATSVPAVTVNVVAPITSVPPTKST